MQILYGKNKSVSLDVPSTCLVVSNPVGSEQSIEQLAQEAVAHPLGLPGLANCFTADDAVAIALGEGVVHPDEILPVLIDQLLLNGIKKENITLVVFGGKTQDDVISGEFNPFSSDSPLRKYNVHVHYTDQPQAYTIVSAMDSGEPLAFVRPIVEADVVIPVGVADPVASASPWSSRLGVFSSVYPRFSMKEAHERFEHPSAFGLDAPDESQDVPDEVRDNISNKRRTAQDEIDDLEEMARIQWEEGDDFGKRQETRDNSEDSSTAYCLLPTASDPLATRNSQLATRQSLAEEARQAGWELGVVLLMEIIPGAGDGVANIVFGTPDCVEKEVERIHSACVKEFDKNVVSGIGKLKFSRKPKQILCAVGGDERRQTWLNVIESLEASAEKGTDNCTLFLCADISQPVGSGFKVVMAGSDLLAGTISAVASTLYRENFPDSFLALRWLRLVDRHRIFWLSNLDCETIEKLGAVPLESIDQLQRAIKQE
ncbi:MAG: DUF2088 domain-containing protein [Thermoguttaceae bacterium]|nr:DUF2088 domain-containing protein [Thermoguttaceae bacterium]